MRLCKGRPLGYDVHITRKEEWTDFGNDISLAEWLAYVRSDPEMRLSGEAEAKPANGEFLRAETSSLSVWTGYSRHVEGEKMVWFALYRGSIAVKNPDPEILRKMHQIASALDARVQGDECEFYGPDGEPET